MKNDERFDFKAFEQALQSLGKGLEWDGEDEWKLNVVVHRFILAYHQVVGALFAYVPKAFPVNGINVRSCVEAAVAGGWIKTPVLWAEMHENRNLAAHPYLGDESEDIYQRVGLYYDEMKCFYQAVVGFRASAPDSY